MLRIAFFINGGQSFSGKIPWWNERLIKNPNGCFRALFILLYPRYEAPNDLRIEIRIIRSNWYRMSEAVSRQWRKVGPKAAKVQLNMNMSFKNLNGNTTRISTFVLIKISQFQGLPWGKWKMSSQLALGILDTRFEQILTKKLLKFSGMGALLVITFPYTVSESYALLA